MPVDVNVLAHIALTCSVMRVEDQAPQRGGRPFVSVTEAIFHYNGLRIYAVAIIAHRRVFPQALSEIYLEDDRSGKLLRLNMSELVFTFNKKSDVQKARKTSENC